MSFVEDFRRLVKEAVKTTFKNDSDLARQAGVSQSALSLFLNDKRKGLQLETVGKLLDTLGCNVNAPADEPEKEVCFVHPKIAPSGENGVAPLPEEYLAVPLVGEAGAGPGVLPQESIASWFLVWRHQDAIRNKSDLLAVEIAKGSTSMSPLLNPGDIVLVHRQDKEVSAPGRVYLVRDPVDGSGKVKRVSVRRLVQERDYQITFYSDNAAENPPEIYSLEKDFDGDWSNAIVGRVVWAWSDVSRK